jgi:hypothetical protein
MFTSIRWWSKFFRRFGSFVLTLAILLAGQFFIDTVNCTNSTVEEYYENVEQQYNHSDTNTSIMDIPTELKMTSSIVNEDKSHGLLLPVDIQVINVTESETIPNVELDAKVVDAELDAKLVTSPMSFEESAVKKSVIDDDYTYDVSFTTIVPPDITANVESYSSNYIQSPQPKASSSVMQNATEESLPFDEVIHDDPDEAGDAVTTVTVMFNSEKELSDTLMSMNHSILNTKDKAGPEQQQNQQIVLERPISKPETDNFKIQTPGSHGEKSSSHGAYNNTITDTAKSKDDVQHQKEVSISSIVANDDDIGCDVSTNSPCNVTQQPILNDDKPLNNSNLLYHCGFIWGDMNVTRRRRHPANLSILQQLFQGEITFIPTETDPRPKATKELRVESDISNIDAIDLDYDSKVVNNESLDKSEESPIPSHLVEGIVNDGDEIRLSDLDDINELFEDVDLPDEFDVSTNDASIQEVLMGSATRVVINRFTILGRFILRKARVAQKILFHHAKKAMGKIKLFQLLSERIEDLNVLNWLPPKMDYGEIVLLKWVYNDDGEFAPFRAMRNTNGEWIFLQKLRNENGKFLGISQTQVQDAAEWVQFHFVNVVSNVNSFFDKILSGPETEDEFDFKFLSDENFSKQKFDPTI